MKYNNQNNLQTIRKKLGLKQIKVAMDLGTTQETISSYETGRIFPNIDMLIALAKYYNTSIDYLLGLTKYDIPTNDIKPNNISDEDFMLLNKINKLSSNLRTSDKVAYEKMKIEIDKAKAEAYIDGLNS